MKTTQASPLVSCSYDILNSLLLPEEGVHVASSSSDYSRVWIRDSIYMSLPYIDKPCKTFERIIWRWLDTMRELEWKLDIHAKQRPMEWYEYIHARYSADGIKEMSGEWGHHQLDAIGALLWAIGEGERRGKKILRDTRDKAIVQKLVYYLRTLEYWQDPDHGIWEEWREVHSSSVGACVAGLRAVSGIVNVPSQLIFLGELSLAQLFPRESKDKGIDLAQLSLIYPYKVLTGNTALSILSEVENVLLRERGVIRYEGDSYYSTLDGRDQPRESYHGHEAEWCMGLPWLALCWAELGKWDMAQEYIKRTEAVMLEHAVLPELYYAGTDKPNPNTPLGWSSALYILAKEQGDGNGNYR